MRIKNGTNGGTIEMALWKAATILAAAVLTTAVGTAYTIITTLNTDHFVLAANTQRIDKIEDTIVPREVIESKLEGINNRLERIEDKIDKL